MQEEFKKFRARINESLKDISLGLYSALMTAIGVLLGFSTIEFSKASTFNIRFLSFIYFLILVIAGYHVITLYLWQRSKHTELSRRFDFYSKHPEKYTEEEGQKLIDKGKSNFAERSRREKILWILLIVAVLLQFRIMFLQLYD